MKSNVESLIEKSVACAVSAIEIYNKPDFKYRVYTNDKFLGINIESKINKRSK